MCHWLQQECLIHTWAEAAFTCNNMSSNDPRSKEIRLGQCMDERQDSVCNKIIKKKTFMMLSASRTLGKHANMYKVVTGFICEGS